MRKSPGALLRQCGDLGPGARYAGLGPENELFDMTELFEELVDPEEKVTVFLVWEYSQDVGQKEDFRRVDGAYEEVFEV
jgi:hypothetical protein